MDLSDPTTFASAYDEHRRGVHAVAYRVLGDAARAQDVVQDVFLRVWRNPQKFDAKRGELGSYLRLIARSRAVDLWREGQAAGRAGDKLKVVVAQEEPRPDERPEHVALHAAERSTVREALRKLPDPQREALVLAYWGGLTADQIAQRAGVPLGTAKSRIRLGLARLRAELGGALGDVAGDVAVAA
jgi:RNA polymerase sigma-70 factor (ECF subfamily)